MGFWTRVRLPSTPLLQKCGGVEATGFGFRLFHEEDFPEA